MKKLIKTYKGTGTGKILIISGVHGNEVSSIYASIEANKFSHEFFKLVEKITFMIGYNESAILADVRYIDFDVNRGIEVRPELEDLRREINEHDIIFDLHTSYDTGTFALIDNDKNANKIVNWCKAAKVPYLLRDFPDEGTTIKKYALNRGKIGVTFEMAGMHKINYFQSSMIVDYIKRLLTNKKALIDNNQVILKNAIELTCNAEGLFKRIVEYGDFIEANEPIGFVFDYEMKKLEEIKSNESGILLVGSGRDFVKRGEVVGSIQPLI